MVVISNDWQIHRVSLYSIDSKWYHLSTSFCWSTSYQSIIYLPFCVLYCIFNCQSMGTYLSSNTDLVCTSAWIFSKMLDVHVLLPSVPIHIRVLLALVWDNEWLLMLLLDPLKSLFYHQFLSHAPSLLLDHSGVFHYVRKLSLAPLKTLISSFCLSFNM